MNHQRHHRRNRSTDSLHSQHTHGSSLDMSGFFPTNSSSSLQSQHQQPPQPHSTDAAAAGGAGAPDDGDVSLGGRRGREGSQDALASRGAFFLEGDMSSRGVSAGTGGGEEEGNYYHNQYEAGMTPMVSATADALSVEGMGGRHDHKKQWEEYYQIFLQRYCTPESAASPLLQQRPPAGGTADAGGSGRGSAATSRRCSCIRTIW